MKWKISWGDAQHKTLMPTSGVGLKPWLIHTLNCSGATITVYYKCKFGFSTTNHTDCSEPQGNGKTIITKTKHLSKTATTSSVLITRWSKMKDCERGAFNECWAFIYKSTSHLYEYGFIHVKRLNVTATHPCFQTPNRWGPLDRSAICCASSSVCCSPLILTESLA